MLNLDIQNQTSSKVSIGKIIPNASGGNTLFLDIGRQEWSTNREANIEGTTTNGNTGKNGHKAAAELEIDGKKVNILHGLKDRNEMIEFN